VVVTLPLVLLAIPSVISGYVVGNVVFGDYFGASIAQTPEEWHGLWHYTVHGLMAPPFWLAVTGIATAWYLYRKNTQLPKRIAMKLGPLYAIVERKYGFDELYSWLFAGGARNLGRGFWRGGDMAVIDGLAVNGSARVVGWFSGVIRLLQTGLVNTYAFLMLFGVLLGMSWVVWRFWHG
jgi:NADH-quinone oxidoreductase subunit L